MEEKGTLLAKALNEKRENVCQTPVGPTQGKWKLMSEAESVGKLRHPMLSKKSGKIYYDGSKAWAELFFYDKQGNICHVWKRAPEFDARTSLRFTQKLMGKMRKR